MTFRRAAGPAARSIVRAFSSAAVLAVAALGCGRREPVPPIRANDARFGRLAGKGEPPSRESMCGRWSTIVFARDEWAITHVSFPETNVEDACFTRVTHEGRNVTVGAPPRGCAYPSQDARGRLERLADELDTLVAQGDDAAKKHLLFSCAMPAGRRAAAMRHDARVLRRIARDGGSHAYSSILVPGHGERAQDQTPLVDWLPGDRCRALGAADVARLGAMPFRAARAADALRGGVAPAIVVSGAAVHSHVVEAFALMHLLQCTEGVEPEHVLLEPCADHTHTNLRNGARWVHAMAGRAAYLLTDDFIQSDYLQDWNGFFFIFGTVDQRSTRDWGYQIGSWRQASVGHDAGFWFTPYRFWAEPKDGLGSFTCVEQ